MPFAEYYHRAAALDRDDRLSGLRAAFHLPPGQVYLDGNSLGPLSVPAEKALVRVLREWRELGVSGWLGGDPPWFGMAEAAAARVARLVGAAAEEVTVANSTTVNLHQLLATLFTPVPGRDSIVMDAGAFPSDLYAVRSHLSLRGLDPGRCLRLVAPKPRGLLDEAALMSALRSDVALAVFPSVVYTTGQLLPLAQLAAVAHARGVLLGLDLSHSIGLMPHALGDWGVDFAFWCHYKYLNAGPGAIGGLFINRAHFGRSPGLGGWFGSRKERQFDMAPVQEPAEGAGSLQIGTPPILSLAPLLGSLELTEHAALEAIRAKSLALTGFIRELFERFIEAHGVELVTPRPSNCRGGHLAFRHPAASQICAALRREGVVPDFRPPDLIRIAPGPLYTRFHDCVEAMNRFHFIIVNERYLDLPTGRELVA
jgi:kynureninase